MQTTKYTSKTAEWLGKFLKYSPAKLEGAIKGLTGAVGGQALQLGDMLQGKQIPKQELPILSRFMGKERDLSKSQQQMYEKIRSIEQEQSGLSRQNKIKAQQVYDSIKNLPVEQQKEQIKKLEQSGEIDKNIFQKMKDIREDDQKSSKGKILSGTSVKARAQIIYDEVKNLSIDQQRLIIRQYEQDGILTKNVFEEMKKLRGLNK